MNNIIIPRQENGQAPDHSNSRYGSGALGNTGMHSNGGGGVIAERRRPELFFRDDTGHTQYLCPNNDVHYDNEGNPYLIVKLDRFRQFMAYLDLTGQDIDDVCYGYMGRVGDAVRVDIHF